MSARQAPENPEYLLTQGQLLVTTDGTVGRVHPVTERMSGWFGSNNMARLWDQRTDMGFLYADVIDHINEAHSASGRCPTVDPGEQRTVGDLVRQAFAKKDEANTLEDSAIAAVEAVVEGRTPVKLASP